MSADRILDVSRLLSRLHRPTPTGIDRVEFAYARHYLRGGGDGLVTTPFNSGLLTKATLRALMQAADERWFSDAMPNDPAWQRLCSILQSPLGSVDVAAPATLKAEAGQHNAQDKSVRRIIARAYVEATLAGLAGRLPRPSASAWYLHVSHINLHEPARLRWLKSNTSPRRAFMVHDLIPISHPEFFRQGEEARHRTRMETIASAADLVIFNSGATQDAWNNVMSGRPGPQGAVIPLGTEPVFLCDGPAIKTDIPYFVVVGTLESRKNLSFLLHVWTKWVQSSPNPQARLVIVGRRGRHSENATSLIDRSAVATSLVEMNELSDVGLAILLRGARALLAPSLIEGFGLPIAEALSLKVPVIASDIPAHREVGQAFAEYLDPLDGAGWFQAVADYAAPSSTRRAMMHDAVQRYRPTTWEHHMKSVEEILQNHC